MGHCYMFSALMWLAIWLYRFLSKTLDGYNYESTCSAKKMCGCWKNHFVSLGTESSRFSTVDYIPESFCIIDLKRHSEDRGGRLSDRLDPESHLSHIFLSATPQLTSVGGEREYMIHSFLSREKATTSNLDLRAIIQERESRNFEHMRINFLRFCSQL